MSEQHAADLFVLVMACAAIIWLFVAAVFLALEKLWSS